MKNVKNMKKFIKNIKYTKNTKKYEKMINISEICVKIGKNMENNFDGNIEIEEKNVMSHFCINKTVK